MHQTVPHSEEPSCSKKSMAVLLRNTAVKILRTRLVQTSKRVKAVEHGKAVVWKSEDSVGPLARAARGISSPEPAGNSRLGFCCSLLRGSKGFRMKVVFVSTHSRNGRACRCS